MALVTHGQNRAETGSFEFSGVMHFIYGGAAGIRHDRSFRIARQIYVLLAWCGVLIWCALLPYLLITNEDPLRGSRSFHFFQVSRRDV